MESKNGIQKLNFVIPQGNELLVKCNIPKLIKEPSKPTFRSFKIDISSGNLVITGKCIPLIHLYNLIIANGASKTMPIRVSLGPTKFIGFDWSSRGNKTMEYFIWNGIKCSITGPAANDTYIYLHIYDLEGERILQEISLELLTHWTNPIASTSLQIYGVQQTQFGFQWKSTIVKPHRLMETIYIPEILKKDMIDSITKFYDASTLYDRFGVTWKYVALFNGVPGTGKTSMIAALATWFQKHIAKLTVTSNMTSEHIEYLFQTIPNDTFLVIEDVDSLFTKREAKQNVDFSTILNCLDGFTTKRGLTAFMTTNHIETLDAAFLRPGRVDKFYAFTTPKEPELRSALMNLASEYLHEHDAYLAEVHNNVNINDIQKHLFDCIMSKSKTILSK